MTNKPTLPAKFYKDLHALQDKYPMCTIDAWTPDDYEFALAQEDDSDAELDDIESDWDNERYVWATQMINKRKDANSGINWQFLTYILEDLHNS